MAPIVIVVVSVFSNKTAQMILVQHDDVVEQFAATISCPSLRDAVLPRAAVRSSDRFHAKRSGGIPNLGSKYSITIMDQILVMDLEWEGLSKLLDYPRRSRVSRCIHVNDLTPSVIDDEENIQQSERDCRNNEKIHGHNDIAMVGKEGFPRLRFPCVRHSPRQVA